MLRRIVLAGGMACGFGIASFSKQTKRHLIRSLGLLFALACAGIGGQTPAIAQGKPYSDPYGPLTNSSKCWRAQLGLDGRWMLDPTNTGIHTGSHYLGEFSSGTVSDEGRTITSPSNQKRIVAVPCPPPSSDIHPFFGFEAGGGWSNMNFAVNPPFGVTGSAFIYGVNGGVLFNLPGTDVSFGPRVGWQGGNITGSTAKPPASPFFIYDVRMQSFFYQEAMVSIPVHRDLFGFERTFLDGTSSQEVRLPFVTLSAGIAEANIKVTGTSGAFQVTDSATRTGFTFSAGFGFPINQTFFPGAVDAYIQYRGNLFEPVDVNIPGRVKTDFWVQGITFGTDFRF